MAFSFYLLSCFLALDSWLSNPVLIQFLARDDVVAVFYAAGAKENLDGYNIFQQFKNCWRSFFVVIGTVTF